MSISGRWSSLSLMGNKSGDMVSALMINDVMERWIEELIIRSPADHYSQTKSQG